MRFFSMRSFVRAARLAAPMLALSLVACSEPDAPPPRTPEIVKVQTIRFEDISRTVSLTGTVAARVESDLSFRIAGRIAERRVDVSDTVKKGDILATLETAEQEADLQSAEATLEAARATLSQAETNFRRQKTLNESGYTTRSTFDAAQEQLRTAEGSVASAEADVGTARDQLSFTVLRADADGIVTARNAEAGQVVAAAQTVFAVAQAGARDAVFDIYEALLAEDPPKDAIRIHLVSDPGVEAFGTVREIAPTFDTTTGTVRVKMSLADPPAAMNLGAAVIGEAPFQSRRLVALPWQALSTGPGGARVWIVDPKTNTVSERAVAVARYRTGDVLVGGGLNDGEIVVTAAGQFLRPGQEVTIASGDLT
jgi:RND family efflux transporter MFP subunit